MTSYGLDSRGFECWQRKRFSLPQIRPDASEARPASYSTSTGDRCFSRQRAIGIGRTKPRRPASEPQLTNPADVQHSIKGPTAGNARDPYCIPNTVLEHLTKWPITFLTTAFNAVLRKKDLPLRTERRSRDTHIEKRTGTPVAFDLKAHNTSDTVSNLSGEILLLRTQSNSSQQFWPPRHSMALQLAVSLRETTGTVTGS
jgi:hypothetical protein